MELFDLNIHFPVTDPTWIFFLVLIIILFAPMILGRLRIPHIIGMILAGVVVGKYGFNILERDSSFELFGKVGLYYIMFLAGLEMDMDDFKKNRTKGLIFGMFTFLIPMGLGIWSSMSMLDYGFLTSVLLAVGARWAASRIRSIASCGTGRSESARFERRALQRSSTCSGEGSPLRSIGWILSGENELWRTEPVGQTAAQCPQTMQESILRRPIGSPGLA